MKKLLVLMFLLGSTLIFNPYQGNTWIHNTDPNDRGGMVVDLTPPQPGRNSDGSYGTRRQDRQIFIHNPGGSGIYYIIPDGDDR